MSMQKSVLTEIIRSLDKKEKREIQKWLQSPAHNQRQDVIRLFEYLQKNVGDADDGTEKQKAWEAIYPGIPFDDAYLRQVMYFLLKAMEEYLVFSELSSDSSYFQLALMRTYRQRNLDKSYKHAYRIAKDYLENQKLRDNTYLQNHFLLLKENGENPNLAVNASGNLQEISDALEKWFIAEKMRVSYSMLAHQKVYKTAHYETGILSDVFAYIEKKDLMEEPAISAYYYEYMTALDPDKEKYFEKFEKILYENGDIFTPSELKPMYVAAVNYCVPKINQGRVDFAQRAFQLYRKGLELKILLENGYVSRYTFGNAVAAAIKIQEFGWAEKFIEDFKGFLEDKLRNSIVNFNLSRIYFEKGEYGKAQKLLREFEYDDLHLNIIAKTMLLKIYFETDEYDAFESLLESMRIYLRRKEALDPTRKTAYKNMISLMKKMVNRNPYSKAQTEKLRELIESTNPLMEREWLLGQLSK